jgi:hypothetical protein
MEKDLGTMFMVFCHRVEFGSAGSVQDSRDPCSITALRRVSLIFDLQLILFLQAQPRLE